MKKIFIAAAMLAFTPLTSAAEFSPLQKKAWRGFCESELGGDIALCSCLQTLQVKDIGEKNVKIVYLTMAVDLPSLSTEEIDEAADGIDELSGGSDSTTDKAVEAYFNALEKNINVCSG
jgi:hypothetical protein